MKDSKNIAFSIIVPVASSASALELEECLKSIFSQTYPPREVKIVISPFASKNLYNVLKRFYQVQTIQKELSKSEARNYAAQDTLGNYLLHLDVDNYLEKNTLEICARFIKEKNARAIYLKETVEASGWLKKIRNLEKKINSEDPDFPAPQIIEKRLFLKIGGYDPWVDILDGWTIRFKLQRAGIKIFRIGPLITLKDSWGVMRRIKRKYLRGQAIPVLVQKYPEFKKVTIVGRLKNYLKNGKILIKNPLLSCGLLTLKILDGICLYWGASTSKTHRNIYETKEVAKNYNRIRQSTNFQLFKNYTEQVSLKLLLNSKPGKVLEIGAGTGRITKFLTKMGIQVSATEPSLAMLNEYSKNKNLPKPILLSAEKISPKLGKFEACIGIRVLWHIKDVEKQRLIFKNATQLIEKTLIFDFANARKYKNLLLYPFFRIYGVLFNPNFYSNDYFFKIEEIEGLAKSNGLMIEKIIPLDILTPIWLNLLPQNFAKKLFPKLYFWENKFAKFIPPGRLLIKFRKNSPI